MSLTVGPFTIDSANDSWSLERFFKPEMETVVDVSLPKIGTTQSLTLASTDVIFTGNAGATQQIELLWPIHPKVAEELSPFGIELESGEVGVRVRLSGTATASAAATLPTGPVKIGLGAAGGGSFTYERLAVYPVTTPITAVLGDTVARLRLPSRATSPDTIPAPKELITAKCGGYLQLSADVSWGAKLASMTGAKVGDLDLAFESKLSLAATAGAKYRIAGTFDIHCCRAGQHLRFIVRKGRESTFPCAADFKLDAEFRTKGLPPTANEFLGKLLGADAARIFHAIDRAQQLDSLDKVRDAVGDWAGDALSGLAMPLIGKALDQDTTAEFLAALKDVAAQYTGLDERIARLFEESLNNIPELKRALDVLAAVKEADALKLLSDAPAWTAFRKLAGDRLYDALLDVKQYQAVLGVVDQARHFVSDGPQRLKTVIAEVQRGCTLDPLIRRLEELSSPSALKGLADAQLRRIVSLLLDRPFKDIEKSAGPSFAQLQQALASLKQFNDLWYSKVLSTANSTFKATVNAEFTHATTTDALLDVEIDVTTVEGQRLARRAALGDFEDVLADARSPLVTLREGVLTHNVTRQLGLRVNVLGFEAKSVSRLILASKDAYQDTDAGLLLVHAFEVASEQERQRRDERTFTRFVLRGAAEAILPDGDRTRAHMIDTMRTLSAGYHFDIEDSNTSEEELLEYLAFAESLGLLTDRSAFLLELRRQLPEGWARVKVEYVVRYEPNAVAAIFRHDAAELQATARASLSALVGRVLIVAGKPNDSRIGLAYRDEAIRLVFSNAKPSVPSGSITVLMPGWVTRDKTRAENLPEVQKELLRGVFRIEEDYLATLVRLDVLMDKLRANPGTVRNPVSTAELDRVAAHFVDLADDFPTNRRVNPFFGTFDALVLATTPRSRRAAMVLEIMPRGGTEPVTKYLSA
jgi:hypothetical protein